MGDVVAVMTGGRAIRVTAGAVTVTLLGAAGLHVVWMFSTWPLATRDDFARLVVGTRVEDLPSPALTAVVAAALAAGAWAVGATGGVVAAPGPERLWRVGASLVAAGLVIRGVGGLAAGFLAPGTAPPEFVRLDRALYSPLCITLGIAAALVWRSGRPRAAGRGG